MSPWQEGNTATPQLSPAIAGRKDFVKVFGAGVNVPSRRRFAGSHTSTFEGSLAFQGLPDECGGPMTVVAGVVALLLLGYLVVALLKPERF